MLFGQEKKRTEMFMKMLAVGRLDGQTEPLFSLRIYYDIMSKRRAAPEQARKLTVLLQLQLLATFWDKLFRVKDVNRMRSLMSTL